MLLGALAPPRASARWPLSMQSAVRDQSTDSMLVECSLGMFNMLMIHRALRKTMWSVGSSYDTPRRVRLQRPCGSCAPFTALEACGAVRHLLRSRLSTWIADGAYETIRGRSTTRVSPRHPPVAFAFRDVNLESTPAYISVLAGRDQGIKCTAAIMSSDAHPSLLSADSGDEPAFTAIYRAPGL
ncbi:hypothetical protein WOLCODRAFT_149682 [Wolfiporia cocos MD-104 SS10]|uniref:Uncharacterized protein n=1 Tax=Wolfiporia cocos (strain MD-104) TaxID=742152 RepID=A0A2H3J901_WOLCO|nr:hypothetical protein WOLCODRAFT_149682 [Wolfiporia cocos MD-104 SS10]